jgi:hypothetical protein
MGTTPHLAWTFNSQPLWSVPPCGETFPCWTPLEGQPLCSMGKAMGVHCEEGQVRTRKVKRSQPRKFIYANSTNE